MLSKSVRKNLCDPMKDMKVGFQGISDSDKLKYYSCVKILALQAIG